MKSLERLYTIFFWVLCIITPFSLAFTAYGVLLFFVFPPFYFLFLFAPSILFALLIARFFHRLVPGKTFTKIVGSTLLTFVLLAALPILLNHQIDREATAFALGDMNEFPRLERGASVAIRYDSRLYGKSLDHARCDPLCAQLLLSGQAQRVLISNEQDVFSEIAQEEEVISFSVKRKETCDVDFKDYPHTQLKLRISEGERPSDIGEAWDVKGLYGECLDMTTARLRDADIVISSGTLRRSEDSIRSLSFELGGDTAWVTRILGHIWDDQTGQFVKVYQKSKIRYVKFAPVLIPVPVYEIELRMHSGWWRQEHTINEPDENEPNALLHEAIIADMNLDTSIDGDKTQERVLDYFNNVLAQNRSVTDYEWGVLSRYYERLNSFRRNRINQQDIDFTQKLLGVLSFPVPEHSWKVARFAAKNASEDQASQIASFALHRLGNEFPDSLSSGRDSASQKKVLNLTIQVMPGSVLQRHKDLYLNVAEKYLGDPMMVGLIAKLHVFGVPVRSQFLGMVKEATLGEEPVSNSRSKTAVFTAGMMGLCRMGSLAEPINEQIFDSIAGKSLPSKLRNLVIATLGRTGFDPDRIYLAYSKSDISEKEIGRILAVASSRVSYCNPKM